MRFQILKDITGGGGLLQREKKWGRLSSKIERVIDCLIEWPLLRRWNYCMMIDARIDS